MRCFYYYDCMPIEQPSNADNLPKLILCDEDHPYLLIFDDQNITKHRDAGPDQKWSCYRIEDMTVVSDDKHETEQTEGTNEIPFWAMEPFFDAYTSLTKKQLKTEIHFVYTRSEDKGGKNTCTITVDE